MPEDPARILATSENRKELSAYARLLARSDRPVAMQNSASG